MKHETILIIGSEGQLGTELSAAIKQRYPTATVVEADITDRHPENQRIFRTVDVLNKSGIHQIMEEFKFSQVYQLAAILSANGERNPKLAWEINITGLMNIFDACVEFGIENVYWPSSIAVFGKDSDKYDTPQNGYMNPSTVYGISKLSGELWCQYYYEKHGLDVRSLRYPGIISYKTLPGGGTTDYAVEIFFEALKKGTYTCFLSADTPLPMMYIDDAVEATLQLMEAPKEAIKNRCSYNLSAISFTPAQIAEEIKKHIPQFEIAYQPDFRQAIADSWPASIDDTDARNDWNWKHRFDLGLMVEAMLQGIKELY
jgi:nucleoside-diphosphate-sugar epimerase